MSQTQLYYVMDPMCSWCWAFRPELKRIVDSLPANVPLHYIMGGLAPDTDRPMPIQLQQKLEQTWRVIQTQTGATFNFDFWHKNQPRRATYPACRAVIAATLQDEQKKVPMVEAIQDAYYLQARNPSDDATLIALAGEIGLDVALFTDDLHSPTVAEHFKADRTLAAQLGAHGFPSLLIAHDGTIRWLCHGYSSADAVIAQLDLLSLPPIAGNDD